MSDLTDKELKNLKPKAKLYKVTDRDGMYAAVTPTGVVSFRYQYRVSGRQEVLTIGRYNAEAARGLSRAPDALEYGMEVSLAEARSLLVRARRQVERGESPSKAKVEKRTASGAGTSPHTSRPSAWRGRLFSPLDSANCSWAIKFKVSCRFEASLASACAVRTTGGSVRQPNALGMTNPTACPLEPVSRLAAQFGM